MRTSSLAVASIAVVLVAFVGCKDKSVATTTTSAAEPVGAPGASAAAPGAAAATKPVEANAQPTPVNAPLRGLKAGEEAAASCESVSKDSQCQMLLTTDPAARAKAVKVMPQLCKTGTIATTCPTANVVGACRVGVDFVGYFYSEGGKPFDTASAKASCVKSHGHWVE